MSEEMMSEGSRQNRHYADTKVTLRRVESNEWLMFTECDGAIVASVTVWGDEATALARATTLAGWFDAELVVEKVGLGEAKP